MALSRPNRDGLNLCPCLTPLCSDCIHELSDWLVRAERVTSSESLHRMQALTNRPAGIDNAVYANEERRLFIFQMGVDFGTTATMTAMVVLVMAATPSTQRTGGSLSRVFKKAHAK